MALSLFDRLRVRLKHGKVGRNFLPFVKDALIFRVRADSADPNGSGSPPGVQFRLSGFDALNGLEKIDLSAVSAITDFADLSANHLNQIGADTIISDGAGNAVTLSNTAAANLQAADFIF